MDGSMFVFFTINRTNIGVKWPNIGCYPDGWRFVGSGRTRPICREGTTYPYYKFESEEQYNGPNSNRNKMKEKLHKYYNKMLKKNYIVDYVIADSYSEIDKYQI